MTDGIAGVFSLSTYHHMRRMMDEIMLPPSFSNNQIRPLPPALFGTPVTISNQFPMDIHCSKCCGNGEGSESTYCERCEGAGHNIYDGMVQNGPQTILIRRKLPKAFAPSFPAGLVPMPPLCRGLLT